jgi:hypothetical protein
MELLGFWACPSLGIQILLGSLRDTKECFLPLPEDGKGSAFRVIALSIVFLEYLTMGKVQKPSGSKGLVTLLLPTATCKGKRGCNIRQQDCIR